MTQQTCNQFPTTKLSARRQPRFRIPVIVLLACVVSVLLQSARSGSTGPAGAGEYELSWYTIDGGGVMFRTADQYELSGTIGQPDAGGPMAAGGYELTGGFWFSLAPGDCNSDAGVNLFDHRDFAACITGPEAGPSNPECTCFDLNRDGAVDLADFALLAVGFTGG